MLWILTRWENLLFAEKIFVARPKMKENVNATAERIHLRKHK